MSSLISFDTADGTPLARGGISVEGLPNNYQQESIDAIQATARVVMFELGVTDNNRDLDHRGERLASVVAAGSELAERLPWLEEYYRGELQAVTSEAMGEEAICLRALDEALLGLAFGPGMRIEAHTDVWAINANLFLKAARKITDAPPELRGGTVIGHPGAASHNEILSNPLAVVGGRVGTLTIIAASKHPHTIGVPESAANFEVPDITTDEFWQHPNTRISFNISYTTARQLAEDPTLRPMTETVGYSIPVLGRNS